MMAETSTAGETAGPQSSDLRTFLIADIRGYTSFTLERGDEAAARLATKFAGLTKEIIRARGGNVIELRGDEALAVFGSARQALRAALELQERFRSETEAEPSLPLKAGVGLDAGEAVAVEGGYRGSPLNLAARLCSLAGPHEVLASEGVVHSARKVEGVFYAERGAVQLKGFTDPVRVVQVLAEDGKVAGEAEETGATERALPIGGFLGALPSSMLVARDQELAKVLSAVDAVAGGSGRLVLLSGEPGVGKTRLAQEVTLNLRNRGFTLGTGRCYEPRQNIPFYPFLEALESLYASAQSAIRSQAAQRWPYLGRLLPEQNLPSPPTTSEGEERERLFRSVTGFLRALAESAPIALMLDDLHWIDASSLDLLEHLARQTRADHVLLLGTYRDVEVQRQHPLGRALRDLNREQLVEDIAVRRLDQDGTAALVAATMGEEEVSDEFAQLLQDRTEGNPFFTQEVLHALVERGDVYRENGRWERRDVEEIEIPKSVREAIGERLSRLTDEAQDVLRSASVLGQTFAFDDIHGLSDRSEDEVEAALEGATAAGLIRAGEEDDYSFHHALTQQALYAELSPRRRRRLHIAAGEALERLPERKQQGRVAELAWHFLQGDDPERALPYAIQAGDEAEQVFAHTEADAHYRTALDLSRELGDRAREGQVLEKLGLVQSLLGRQGEALDLLEQAASLHHGLQEREAERRVIARIGDVQATAGATKEAIERLKVAVDAEEERAPTAGMAAVYSALASAYFRGGLMAECLEAAETASELARQTGARDVLAMSEMRRGTALNERGRWEEGVPVLEEVIKLAESTGELGALGRAINNLAFAFQSAGELERNLEYRMRGLEVARKEDNVNGILFGNSVLAQSLHYLGRLTEAEPYAQRAFEMARSRERSWQTKYALLQMGWECVVSGEWDSARQYLEEGIAAAIEEHDVQGIGFGLSVLAELSILSARPEDVLDRFSVLDSPQIWLTGAEAWVRLETGDSKGAERLANTVIEGDEHARLSRAEAIRVRGAALGFQGKYQEAERDLETSLGMAREMGYQLEEGRSLYEYGRMLARKGESEQARQRFDEATALFERLPAPAYVALVEQAVEEVL